MMKNIVAHIKVGGFFVGNFFGRNDDWKYLVLSTEEELRSYFRDFEILEVSAKEYDRATAKDKTTLKHWHEILVIARKID